MARKVVKAAIKVPMSYIFGAFLDTHCILAMWYEYEVLNQLFLKLTNRQASSNTHANGIIFGVRQDLKLLKCFAKVKLHAGYTCLTSATELIFTSTEDKRNTKSADIAGGKYNIAMIKRLYDQPRQS